MNARNYLCECSRRSCRERISLGVVEYRRAAELGLVVVPAHARVGTLLEVHRVSGYAIVSASPRYTLRGAAA